MAWAARAAPPKAAAIEQSDRSRTQITVSNKNRRSSFCIGWDRTKLDLCQLNTRLSRRGFGTAANVAVVVLASSTLHAARFHATHHNTLQPVGEQAQSTAQLRSTA